MSAEGDPIADVPPRRWGPQGNGRAPPPVLLKPTAALVYVGGLLVFLVGQIVLELYQQTVLVDERIDAAILTQGQHAEQLRGLKRNIKLLQGLHVEAIRPHVHEAVRKEGD